MPFRHSSTIYPIVFTTKCKQFRFNSFLANKAPSVGKLPSKQLKHYRKAISPTTPQALLINPYNLTGSWRPAAPRGSSRGCK